MVFGKNVVNLVLVILCPADVLIERLVLRFAARMGRCKSQQFCELLFVCEVLDDAFFEDLSEFAPERVVLIAFGQLAQHIEHALCKRTAHCRELRILLQQFSGHIQRQVRGIHDAFYKSQVQRQKLLCIVHDEDALYV